VPKVNTNVPRVAKASRSGTPNADPQAWLHTAGLVLSFLFINSARIRTVLPKEIDQKVDKTSGLE
jgi:hypothetical protein